MEADDDGPRLARACRAGTGRAWPRGVPMGTAQRPVRRPRRRRLACARRRAARGANAVRAPWHAERQWSSAMPGMSGRALDDAGATAAIAAPRRVPFDAPWMWLAAGWRDLWAIPGISLTYGALFAATAALAAL